MFRFQPSRCLLVACLRFAKGMNTADARDTTHEEGCCALCGQDCSNQINWREQMSVTAFSNDGRPYRLSLSEQLAVTAQHNEDPPDQLNEDPPKQPKEQEVPTDPSDHGRIKRFDWREHGAVTTVRDQKDCGCCYIISSIGSIEALGKITTGKLEQLSLQQIIDCDLNSRNDGCYGGKHGDVFEYVMKFGVTTEKVYPFTSSNFKRNRRYQPKHKRYKRCKKVDPKTLSYISGFQIVKQSSGDTQQSNGDALEAALLINPVVVTVAVNDQFRTYKGGIITLQHYPPPTPSELSDPKVRLHSVLLVAFDENECGTRYWVGKNSWGDQWGEGGYFRLQRDVSESWGVLGVYILPGMYPTGYTHRCPIPPSPATASSCISFPSNIAVRAKNLLYKDYNFDQNFSLWTPSKSGLLDLQYPRDGLVLNRSSGLTSTPFRTLAARLCSTSSSQLDDMVESRHNFTRHGVTVALQP